MTVTGVLNQGGGELNASVKISGGTLNLWGGATLKVQSNLEMASGSIRAIGSILASKDTPALAATVSGSFRMTGGTVEINSGTGDHTFGLFNVSGDVRWYDGMYKSTISSTHTVTADLWDIGGRLFTGIPFGGPLCKIDISSGPANPLPTQMWLVITAAGGVSNVNNCLNAGLWTIHIDNSNKDVYVYKPS